jgi:hypothetical protein
MELGQRLTRMCGAAATCSVLIEATDVPSIVLTDNGSSTTATSTNRWSDRRGDRAAIPG